jgi:hypothetical protein
MTATALPASLAELNALSDTAAGRLLGVLIGRRLVAARDLDFAGDLSLASATRRGLSQKQGAWAKTLAARALGLVEAPAQAPRPTATVSAAPIFALLGRALAAGLKFPKIRLTTAGGQLVVLGVAGPRSKYAGQVMVTDGGPFGSNQWFGVIAQDGTWTKSRAVTADVEALLLSLAADPAQVARAYGRATGQCCFCAKDLTTAESVTVGYGPVCAANFGLPWGEEVESTTVIVEAGACPPDCDGEHCDGELHGATARDDFHAYAESMQGVQ